MNIPSRESGNWSWRFRAEQLTPAIRGRFGRLTDVYGRNPRRFVEQHAEKKRKKTQAKKTER